jgi:thioesterase domain-containing protein/acyl carrier protein
LRGPMIFTHYHNNEDATCAAFTTDGWFRTGDIGQIQDGRLSLVGRHKDSIIVSGVNYFSHELETTLEKLEGIERSFVASFPTRQSGADTEQLVVTFATEFPLSDEARLYQLIAAVRNTTVMLWGFRPAIILPLPKSVFPKTSLGKIQRVQMRKHLEAGDFAAHLMYISDVVKRYLGIYTPPDGSVECGIVEIFSEIFGVGFAELSTTVSFFELGGTSLDILKLTRMLERRFGLAATLTTVLQYPTVRQLAARIVSGARLEGSEYDPIVAMQCTGQKAPLFCIHPGNGGVLTFVNLAKYFVNERPFYALRPRGFGSDEECFKTFEELVQTYHNAICKRQPHGPYALAGYSAGGPIAFEIAKLIEARGERVGFLGCIDYWPCEGWPPSNFASTAVGLASLLQLLDTKQEEESLRKVQTEPPDWDPCEYLFQLAPRERLAELDLDFNKFSVWARVAHSLFTLSRSHLTSGTLEAMTIFYGDDALMDGEWRDRIRRWDKFVRRPKYVKVAGSHFTLMAPTHVAGFQAVLRAELNLAFENLPYGKESLCN